MFLTDTEFKSLSLALFQNFNFGLNNLRFLDKQFFDFKLLNLIKVKKTCFCRRRIRPNASRLQCMVLLEPRPRVLPRTAAEHSLLPLPERQLRPGAPKKVDRGGVQRSSRWLQPIRKCGPLFHPLRELGFPRQLCRRSNQAEAKSRSHLVLHSEFQRGAEHRLHCKS